MDILDYTGVGIGESEREYRRLEAFTGDLAKEINLQVQEAE